MRTTRERLEDILEFIQLIQQHLPDNREAYDADVVSNDKHREVQIGPEGNPMKN
jgi:hypothetical protein